MKRIHKDILRYYWQKTRAYPGLIALTLIGLAGGISHDLLAPYIYKTMIDLVAAQNADPQQIFFLLAIVLVSGLTLGQFWRFAGFAHIKLQILVLEKIANEAFSYLQKHSYNFFSNSFTGALVKKLNRFANGYENIHDRSVWNLLTLTIRTTMTLAVLLFSDWRIALAFLIWLSLFVAMLRWHLNRNTKHETATADRETAVTAQLADAITNFENIKLFSSLKFEEKLFAKKVRALRKQRHITWGIHEYYFWAQAIYMAIGEFLILFLTLKLWEAGTITIGTFILVQAYIVAIMFRIWDLSHVFKDMYSDLANAEEMMEIYQQKHEIADKAKATELKVTRGQIELQNLTYTYEKSQKVFRNLNIKIKPQEKVALVGESGAGKSTFVKLLLRLYDIDKGAILIDHQDITEVTQDSLREHIAFVPQDPVMFHRTIMENIRYGRHNATDKEVIRAAKLARCHEFITKSKDGYKTHVGERGIKLSGGERQRIAIARAILKNAPILVLDEATSSLDSKSEKLIQEALEELMHNKTVIAIAHRLSTVREMDRIIVLDNGKVIEEGRHDQLIKQDAHYAELWKIQSGGMD